MKRSQANGVNGKTTRPAKQTKSPTFSSRPLPAPTNGATDKLNGEHHPPDTSTKSATDSQQLYFREICEVDLLAPAEEIKLARRIRRGDKLAREQMIRANLRLVVMIARGYEGLGLPLPDLINEGNLGLMKSVGRFRPGKGAKFSTYAIWWIRQGIRRALSNQSKTIRLPVHVVDRLSRIRRVESALCDRLKRDPTEAETAAELGLSAAQVRTCLEAQRAPLSLQSPLGDETEMTLADTLADANAELPSEQTLKAADLKLLREMLATLKPRERKILGMRFGLEDGEPKRLERVGRAFGLTRERIRQIQEQALNKLRAKINRCNGLA